jgi:hypothetical protein
MDATNEISAENLLLKFDEIMSIAKAIEKTSRPLHQISHQQLPLNTPNDVD